MRKLIDSKRVLVSLPSDIRQWLEARAQYNAGTVSSEVVRLCRSAMDVEADARARRSAAAAE